MDLINKKDLKNLMGVKKSWCISLYMPTRRAGREKRQNPILFKNLVKKAEDQLLQAGIPEKERQKFMKPAQEILGIHSFWQHQSDGLAVFLSSGLFLTYRFPERFEELVVVARRFHLKPLLPLLSRGKYFYVLALSQNEVRLFRGTRYSMNIVNLEHVPGSLKEALKYDEPETQLQFHTQTRHRWGTRAAVFHGHGAGIDDKKDDLLHYFQKIDKGLQDILGDEEAPLVLASVDYYWPIFKEASSYSHLIGEGIKGSPDEIDEDELQERAWKIVQPVFAEEQRETLAAYAKFEAEGKTSTYLDIVVPAAHHGRVAVLFVALGIQRWGVYKPRKNEVLLHEKATAANQDLLDLAAVQTFLNDGRVFALAPEKMPAQGSIAAIFRY
jgi:hypothetical protein